MNIVNSFNARLVLITLALVAAPRVALACPVCFGQSDSPMAWAMNTGILFMLVVVGGVLAGFASFFVHLMRRARLAEVAGSAEAEHGELGGTA